MGFYFTSDGERLSQETIDRRYARAGRKFMEDIRYRDNVVCCEECGVNEYAGIPIDCAHIKSRQHCKNDRQAELIYDPKNFRALCRACHQEFDNNAIVWEAGN